MPSSTTFSVLDVLDLPRAERELFLEIARQGPVHPRALETTGRSPDEIERALEQLVAKKRIRRLPDQRVDVVMGKTKAHTTLPPQLWPALLSPQRLYSEQEIAVLKIAIPMLQFVRATLSSFADHGPHHALRVKTFATQLGYIFGLSETERRVVRLAALFHDMGNVIDRDTHHLVSERVVERLTELGVLPLSNEEAQTIGLLCRWHRRDYDPERTDRVRGELVRTGVAASALRVADAMDIDSRRSDYDQKFRFALEFFFPEKRPYFTSLEEIYGVRVVCTPAVTIQVFTRGVVRDNIQIEALHSDLSKTPLPWTIEQLAIPPAEPEAAKGGRAPERRALVAFPFDPHSIVMAALSRKQLQRANFQVELFCYPDTPASAQWLWRDAMRELNAEQYEQLVVIGDRPDPMANDALFETLAEWQARGACVSLLNRHEARWILIPQLLARNVQVTLGTDWAYFWGSEFSPSDFEWARLAALATRDSTMAAIPVSPEDEEVVRGLVWSVLDAERRANERGLDDSTEWLALAEPLLERIETNDRAYFSALAPEFKSLSALPHGRIEGRFLVLEEPPAALPQAFFWMLEHAIEANGLTVERGTCYNTPYALLTRRVEEQIEIVAMSHWREEHAPPLRLLYPDIGPRPEGTENTFTVRVPVELAAEIVARLAEASKRT